MPSSNRILRGNEAASLPKLDFGAMGNPLAKSMAEPKTHTPTLEELLAEQASLKQIRQEIEHRAAQVEVVREQAYQEGLERGRQAGYEEGWNQAHLERQTLVRLSTSLKEEITQLQEQMGEQILTLAVNMARRILMDSITADPSGVRPLFSEALDVLGNNLRHIVVYAHPDTLVHLQSQYGDNAELSGIRLVPDPKLALGGFRLAHAEGEYDCTLETRWKNVLAALGRKDPLSAPTDEPNAPERD